MSSDTTSEGVYGYGRGADLHNDGYKGYLSKQQQDIYEQFRKAQDEIDVKAKADHLAAHPEDATKLARPTNYKLHPDHKEYTALRFLRARKFVLKDAIEMYTKHMKWRYTYDVDHLLCADSRPPKADLVAKLVPHYAHGWDYQGRPVFFEKAGKVDSKTVVALVTEKEYLLNHIAKMENHLKLQAEQFAKTGKYVETFTLILDLEGAHLAANNSGYAQQCFDNDTNNFPECLGQLIIINAPWVFPVFWKLASPFIDKKTKQKITIVYGKYDAALRQVMSEDQIPVCYGGKCTQHADQPGGCLPETDLKDLKLSDVSGVSDDTELKEAQVGAGKKHEEKHVLKAGDKALWYFRSEPTDVSFSVVFESSEKSHTVHAAQRTHTHQGSYRTESTGTLTLVFDNHHSYFKSKMVRYSVVLIDAKEATDEPQEGVPDTTSTFI